jgi:hypothetical protein
MEEMGKKCGRREIRDGKNKIEVKNEGRKERIE